MKLTNQQVLEHIQMLNKLMESDKTLPVKVNFAINKNADALESIGKAYQEARQKAVNSAGLKQGDEIPQAVREQLQELLEIENDVQIHMIEEEDVPDGLTMAELRAFFFMISSKQK